MSTRSIPISSISTESRVSSVAIIVGRILFSLVFIVGGLNHFSPDTIAFAAQQGVPVAGAFVPIAGLMAILGGLSIAFGYQIRWGAWLLILFLVPVTFSMHKFWIEKDVMMFQIQLAMFMKNLSMLGAALFISQLDRSW
jgi:putative oxidoreductase